MCAKAARRAQPAVALKQLALADVQVDVLARTVALGSVKLVQPAVQIVRAKDGRLNVQGWVVAGGPAPAAPPVAPAPPAWQLSLNELLLDGGQLRFADSIVRRGAAEPVRAELSGLRVALQNLQWHGERAVPPANLRISARVGGVTRDRQHPSGAIDFNGRVGMQPLLANGQLRVERVPVQLFKAYFPELAPLTLVRAEVGYTGSVDLRQRPAGLELAAAGDVLLGDVHIATLPRARRASDAVRRR